MSQFHLSVEAALEQLPAGNGPALRFATLLRRGSLLVEVYAPEGVDRQQPHRQDELYIVIAGSGMFVNGAERHAFGPGDVLFVPAGVEHRFEEFSADFATWVIFFGPDGGEQTA